MSVQKIYLLKNWKKRSLNLFSWFWCILKGNRSMDLFFTPWYVSKLFYGEETKESTCHGGMLRNMPTLHCWHMLRTGWGTKRLRQHLLSHTGQGTVLNIYQLACQGDVFDSSLSHCWVIFVVFIVVKASLLSKHWESVIINNACIHN